MNCFTKKTGNTISGEHVQYSEEYEKMLWMREARIRTFMQLELEACQEEIVWMITCVQMTLSRVIDKMVVDEGRALQPCRYRLFTHMSCIILYPYST